MPEKLTTVVAYLATVFLIVISLFMVLKSKKLSAEVSRLEHELERASAEKTRSDFIRSALAYCSDITGNALSDFQLQKFRGGQSTRLSRLLTKERTIVLCYSSGSCMGCVSELATELPTLVKAGHPVLTLSLDRFTPQIAAIMKGNALDEETYRMAQAIDGGLATMKLPIVLVVNRDRVILKAHRPVEVDHGHTVRFFEKLSAFLGSVDSGLNNGSPLSLHQKAGTNETI